MRAALKVKALTSDSASFIDGARIGAAEGFIYGLPGRLKIEEKQGMGYNSRTK